MIQFFKDIFNGFKKSSKGKKVLYLALIQLYIIIIVLLSVKINVEAITPGGITLHVASEHNIKKEDFEKTNLSVLIETKNDTGKVYAVGVHSIKKISLFQYLISRFNDDISYLSYNPKTDPSRAEDLIRGEISKDISIINALIVAYEEAKKVDPTIHLDYEYEGALVTYVNSISSFNNLHKDQQIKPGDIITHLNDEQLTPATLVTKVSEIDNNASFKLTYKRYDANKKEYITINSVIKKVYDEETDRYIIGIEQTDSFIINEETVNPKFKLQQKYPSIGGSGGAMQALAIYNSLFSKDITNGQIVIGTGSIAVDSYNKNGQKLFGEVGIIGGVAQKIVTAHLHNADVFFCSSANIDEAKAKALEIGAKFEVIEVETFADIINYFRGDTNE